MTKVLLDWQIGSYDTFSCENIWPRYHATQPPTCAPLKSELLQKDFREYAMKMNHWLNPSLTSAELVPIIHSLGDLMLLVSIIESRKYVQPRAIYLGSLFHWLTIPIVRQIFQSSEFKFAAI